MRHAALEAGARDVESDEEGHTIITEMADFGDVSSTLEQTLETPQRAGLIWQAHTPVTLAADKAESILKLIDKLEDLDDVQSVFTNAEFDDETLEKLAAA